MSLVPAADLLREADRDGYAVGAFNCCNMETVWAVISAAGAENAPVIVQASPGAIRYAGLRVIAALTAELALDAGVPVALHLDHGTGLKLAAQCAAAGFTSVMFDGSALPLVENIALTRRVVTSFGPRGISVEAELGKIQGTEDDIIVSHREAALTDAEEARYFVQETGVDCLAVAIGTAHGRYRAKPELDFERLSRIKARVRIPLVLHGASGVPADALQEAIRRGISKINIDTDIRMAFTGRARRTLNEHPDEIDPRKVLGAAREAAREVIREKMRLFGGSGRARA